MTRLTQTAKVGEVEAARWIELDRHLVMDFCRRCEAAVRQAILAKMAVAIERDFADTAPVSVISAGCRRAAPTVVRSKSDGVDRMLRAKTTF